MALFSPARGHSLLWHMQTFPFEFPNQEKLHESYNGINVRLRYFIKFSIARQYSSNIGTQYIFLSYSDWFDLEMQWKSKIFGCKRSHRTQTSTTRSRWKSALKIAYISNLSTTRPSMALWNCEIVLFSVWAVSFGLENVSHSRPFVHFANAICARYHLKDIVVGKIYFLLVRIKIKHMELAIIRRESTGSGHLCSSQPRVCVCNPRMQAPTYTTKVKRSRSSKSWMGRQSGENRFQFVYSSMVLICHPHTRYGRFSNSSTVLSA